VPLEPRAPPAECYRFSTCSSGEAMISSSMIQDLSNPEALPDETKRVSLVQTHISFVVVADRFVYKIKKPVNFGFLDFLTLEKRAFYCRQEVDLNRRLARDIYVDVLPVFYDGKRHSMRDKGGEVVEYAVKMKRIPSSSLMISRYNKRTLTESICVGWPGSWRAFTITLSGHLRLTGLVSLTPLR
jgi:aminoglycoside phosphotransferase family enzyme